MPCDGSCCVAFPLGASRTDNRAAGELPILARLWVDPDITDGLDLLAMVIPLTHEEARERRGRFGIEGEPDPDRDYFACRHWDEETRLCGNYENRPEMCRAFPYGKPCEHGCDCDCDYAPRVWDGDYA